jgi:hypothetical protein
MMLAVIGGVADVERRSNPYPHRRGQEPRQGPRAAYARPSGTSAYQALHRHSRKRPPIDARRALRSTSRSYAVGTGQVFRQHQP